MRTKFKKNILISVLLISISFGCSESLLDIEQKGVTTQENFYQTDKEALQGVVAAYETMQTYNLLAKMCLSDDVYAGGGARADQVAYEELNEFTFGPSNMAVYWGFKLYYRGIYLANKVIDLTNDGSDERKKIIAEAKAIRAFYYFDLVTMWGGVPLVLHELNPDEYAQSAASVADIWVQIEKDLQEAIAVLPFRSKQPDGDRFRFSKGAAQSLLGKAYLFQKKYANAAQTLETVISSGEYALYPDYSKLLRAISEFCSESVLEIVHTAAPWPGRYGANSGFFTLPLLGPRAEYFTPGTTGIMGGWGFGGPTQSIYDAYIAAGDDVRRKGSMMTESEIKEKGGSLRSGNNLPYGNVGVIRTKYTTWADETVGPNFLFSFGTDFRLIRYADVLLMAAEANNRSGNDAKALQYVNQVRARVLLPALTETGDALFAKIKTERRLELSFEGQRFQDLIRWGDAPTVLANQWKQIPKGNGEFFQIGNGGFKSHNILLPIPLNELNVNKNLSQNQGY